MELNKIIFDKSTGNSFGLYRRSGKLSTFNWFINWISTQHNRDSLKKIYPNTSIVYLDSPQLGDFEKRTINDLVENTKWMISDYYKIGIFDGGNHLTEITNVKHYFIDYLDTSNPKVDKLPIDSEIRETWFKISGTKLFYFTLRRNFRNTRCLILKQDDFRSLQLNLILE
jgi:hypothetical protein